MGCFSVDGHAVLEVVFWCTMSLQICCLNILQRQTLFDALLHAEVQDLFISSWLGLFGLHYL